MEPSKIATEAILNVQMYFIRAHPIYISGLPLSAIPLCSRLCDGCSKPFMLGDIKRCVCGLHLGCEWKKTDCCSNRPITLRLNDIDGYMLGYLLRELSRTDSVYLEKFVEHIRSRLCMTNYSVMASSQQVCLRLKMKVVWPEKCVIDMNWNYRMMGEVFKRLELDNSFSWLSTLGGAYSSLGDYFPHFSREALNTSFKQLQLAHSLGDLIRVSKCKVFVAIALMQQGKLRNARRIIKQEYRFAYTREGNRDRHLVNMCQGVWAQLKAIKHYKASISQLKICDLQVIPN